MLHRLAGSVQAFHQAAIAPWTYDRLAIAVGASASIKNNLMGGLLRLWKDALSWNLPRLPHETSLGL